MKIFDLNFDKEIRFGARRIVLTAAVFNLANSNTALAQTARQNTSTANYLTTIIDPRVARFGMRVNF